MKESVSTFSCLIEFAPYVSDHLKRGGFQVCRRESSVPAIFDYVVSDGVRRSALTAVKHPLKKDLTLILAPLSWGWRLPALFGRKKFSFALTACLLNASWSDPDKGFQGAGVVAPLKPSPSLLSASAAQSLPRFDNGKENT